MPDQIEDDIDAIKALPAFRTFACHKCQTSIRVHALDIYANCPKCGLQHKTRSFGGIGTEVHDVIDAVLDWAGISREEVKRRQHETEKPGYQRRSEAKEVPFTGLVRVLAFAVLGAILGAIACFVLWLIFGGWGPPSPLLFVGMGLILGIIASFAKPRRRPPK